MNKQLSESTLLKLIFAAVCVIFILLISSVSHAKGTPEDEDLYLTGYIKALLQEKYSMEANVAVRSGEVFLPDTVASSSEYETMIQDISKLKGVKTVKLVPQNQMDRIGRVWAFPDDTLFRPIIADPRWPQFSAAYHYYTKSINYNHSFDAAFGKSFSLVRAGLGQETYTEIGLQASVFANFDLDTTSFDLVNADYLVGLPISFQLGDAVTIMGRIYHQSSHLGDEYLLHNSGVQRINLSYEAVDFLVSFEPTDWFRLYGGGGNIFSRSPSTYGKWLYQTGIELRVVPDHSNIPVTVLALDVKGAEETGYTPSWSAVVGIELKRNVIVSVDFYDGYSPKGQFYKERVQLIGMGIRFF